MLNLFYDFIPVALFVIAFKLYGIYVATVVGIIATGLQVLITRLWRHRFDKTQLITFFVFILFGGMTLYFHNPIFVKWKPTVIFWILGMFFLLSHFIGKKTIIQRMLEGALEKQNTTAIIPTLVWKKLNLAWTIFFISLGAINLYIAYSFSTDIWVNFKLYGILGLVMSFSFLQAICLSRYLTETK